MYQHDTLDGKLQQVQVALEKVKEVEDMISNLQQTIFSTFHRRLLCDTSDLREGVENIYSFVKCMTESRVPISSINCGYFSLLPVELIFHIISFLDVSALSKCCIINWEFKRLCEENKIWKDLCNKGKYEAFWLKRKLIVRTIRSSVNKHQPDLPPRTSKIQVDGTTEQGKITYDINDNLELEPNWKEVYKWYAESSRKLNLEKKIGCIVDGDETVFVTRGKMTFGDGTVYAGEWLIDSKGNSRKHGRGVQTWIDGDVYKGEWKKDKRTGYGIHIWPDMHYYEGYYDEDKRSGLGLFRWPDGREYRGNYAEDQRNGQGEFIWPNGDRYIGQYKNSNRNGNGSFSWADGRKYDGDWKDGGYHGRGVYTHRDGCTFRGEWKDNSRHGSGRFTWPNGDYYEGLWADGKRCGSGIFYKLQEDGTFVPNAQMWDEKKFDKRNKGEYIGEFHCSSDDEFAETRTKKRKKSTDTEDSADSSRKKSRKREK